MWVGELSRYQQRDVEIQTETSLPWHQSGCYHDILILYFSYSAQSDETPHFVGSINTLRQIQRTLLSGKSATVSVREKPLVSLSVGMSALSVVLVLIMLLGVCHRNAPDARGAGSSGSSAAQRQRQAAAARRRARARNRRRENGNRNSIGTQADVPEPSDRLFILPRPEFTRRIESVSWKFLLF